MTREELISLTIDKYTDLQRIKKSNGGGKWFEDYLAGGKKQNFARDTFKKLYKRNGGL